MISSKDFTSRCILFGAILGFVVVAIIVGVFVNPQIYPDLRPEAKGKPSLDQTYGGARVLIISACIGAAIGIGVGYKVGSIRERINRDAAE